MLGAPEVKDMYALEKEYGAYVKRDGSSAVDLSCWLPSLRNFLRPIMPGELVMIMADTGVGKTAILQNIAVCARSSDILLFELELPGVLCFERFAAISNSIRQEDIEQRYKGSGGVRIGGMDHIKVCDQAGLTVSQLESAITETSPDCVMIDYVGLIQAERARSRYERMSDVAESLKVMAKNTNTVVIAATQIHRKGDDYPDTVSIHDAKDSGSIENSAGVLIGAWRKKEDPINTLCIKVIKNTKGPIMKEPVECIPVWETMTIRESFRDVDGDVALGEY